MKNKDLGTVEFLIFLIKHFFSSTFHYFFVFCSHFWKLYISNFGKKNLCSPVQHSSCNYHLRFCISKKPCDRSLKAAVSFSVR